ncbi:3-deoxy-D-manno-octulosonic-acid transferase [Actinobacillus equuli]|nr:3-deoxy-D-manno-octulosonic-acid transferase [Actinobacillus equuli]
MFYFITTVIFLGLQKNALNRPLTETNSATFFYTILSYIIQPLILLMMWNRGRKQPAYRRRLWERYGYYNNDKQPNENGIIVHAASVGEVIAATPLIKAIQAKYPTLPITVTTVTPTGSARVRAAFGNSVSHFICLMTCLMR